MRTRPKTLKPEATGRGHEQNRAAGTTIAAAESGDGSALPDFEALLRAAGSVFGIDLARAQASLGARLAATHARLGQMSSAVAWSARQAATAAHAYVQRRPWQVAGLGAIVGLLAGIVLARRRE
jgi:ElaB/YqjD/DUF883 family membrane-anchored ribosome-binding protein